VIWQVSVWISVPDIVSNLRGISHLQVNNGTVLLEGLDYAWLGGLEGGSNRNLPFNIWEYFSGIFF